MAEALPARRDFVLSVRPLLPLMIFDLINTVTHIPQNIIGLKNVKLCDSRFHLLSMAAADIGDIHFWLLCNLAEELSSVNPSVEQCKKLGQGFETRAAP